MFNRPDKTTVARFSPALLLGASLLLAGCQSTNPADEMGYQSQAFYDRYPIKVAKAPIKVGVVAKSGSLRPEQVNAVVNFARDARDNAQSRVAIKWPSGSAKSRQVAIDIAQLLVDEGVPQSMIKATSYPGGATEPIQMSFERKVAVTRECGDWSQNLANDSSNGPYPNFGCAYQNNIAALVANPEDFEHPRATSPVLASNRTEVMKVFIKNSTAGDYWSFDGTRKSGG
ncbi:MAG: CpaD family pilus assembly protein [Rhizobiales bacterium]|nr:CpaD family pilus assembly protein [Hyphomicrobiales bacterium]MBI3673677.1 CpaD family pilus assembly protein [Hyphomicrobiales bacterium]